MGIEGDGRAPSQQRYAEDIAVVRKARRYVPLRCWCRWGTVRQERRGDCLWVSILNQGTQVASEKCNFLPCIANCSKDHGAMKAYAHTPVQGEAAHVKNGRCDMSAAGHVLLNSML